MGRVVVVCMKKRFLGKNIVVVIGGMIIEVVVEMMMLDFKNCEFLFVFVRGGLGEDVKN